MPKPTKQQAATAAAYQSIHYFFDLYFLSSAILLLEDIIEGAAATSMCKTHKPSNLLFFTKQLEALCNAAFIICNTKNGNNIGSIPLPQNTGTPRIEQYHNYMPPNTKLLPWEFLPRHLSWDEYHTPYIAIKKFATAMPKISWYKILYELLEYAVDNNSISDACPVDKLLLVRKRLLALIEAFHLIEVRHLKKNKPT